jgi:hypothetical protein
MARATSESSAYTRLTRNRRDNADRHVIMLEHWALLDVRFEISEQFSLRAFRPR